MIAVDSSALIAVVLGEADAERFLAAMGADAASLSAVSLTEATIVAEARQGADAVRDLELLVAGVIDRVVAVDATHARAAAAAWRRFGKGRHPAGLNLGDCFAYATASLAGAPLLFKGNDFAQTDLPAA
ncbi:type II toxin-antitoxin system VapC family toxin [Conexibacter sp. DBS9H8]|uniref:type II toxin-antitoxin system VapC family toxin n=1 Tax=Conexibacter sp. DBS9H8 TaxID=2937801 RepID=UPI00200BA7A2|nr:type II toxin-antitoxin system VapC family toxin [Conexibacter sp. DBS9H8]